MNHSLRKIGWLFVALVVLARSAVFAVPGVRFNADEAVTGLMARHLEEGRAFPVFQYGHAYVLTLEAWLGAALMALTGHATPTIVKSIPIAINVIAGALLYWTLSQTVRLGPWVAALAILPFAIPGPTTGGDLTDALGMNVEPFLFAVLLWHFRERPVLLGITAAIALLNREFTIYALAGLAFVEFLRDRVSLLAWRRYAVAIVAFALTWTSVGLLKSRSTPLGPGTTFDRIEGASDNVELAAEFLCVDPASMRDDVRAVATQLLPLQLGFGTEALGGDSDGLRFRSAQSLLWPSVAVLLLFGVARGLRRARREGATPATWFGLYLFLIGLQAIGVYATLRCGGIGPGNLRYMLLSLLAPVGAITLALERERRPAIKTAFYVGVGLWASLCLVNDARLWYRVLASPPEYEHQELADYLLGHGIHFITTDYWTGYHVAFLTGERVKPLTDFGRVLEYDLAVKANMDRVVEVRRVGEERCTGGVAVAAWYVCAPPSAPP